MKRHAHFTARLAESCETQAANYHGLAQGAVRRGEFGVAALYNRKAEEYYREAQEWRREFERLVTGRHIDETA